MNPSPTFSVVIPTRNRLGTLRMTIESIQAQDFPPSQFEVIVVNDGSSDGTAEYLQSLSHLPHVAWLDQVNSGAAQARNRGIEHARGTFVAFTDDDCVVPSDWLSALSDALDQGDVSAVGGRSVNMIPDDPYAALYAETWEFFFEQLNRSRHEPLFLVTNNFACRRSVLTQLGGFDPGFYVGGEDRELCARLRQEGKKIMYAPHIVIQHRHPFTFRSFLAHHVRMGEGSFLLHQRIAGQGILQSQSISPGAFVELLGRVSRKHHPMKGLQNLFLLGLAQSFVLLGYGFGALKSLLRKQTPRSQKSPSLS
ncbi:MAG: glycosyltransferase [Ignavibacteriales bacterium]|nr:glycosyltransferase [Ignavibacteriales bacterium]